MSLVHIPSTSEIYFKISKIQNPSFHQLPWMFGLQLVFPDKLENVLQGACVPWEVRRVTIKGCPSTVPALCPLLKQVYSQVTHSLNSSCELQRPEPNCRFLCCRTHSQPPRMCPGLFYPVNKPFVLGCQVFLKDGWRGKRHPSRIFMYHQP